MGILFLIVFTDLIGFGMVIPLLPYYALYFHASPLALTALMAAFSFAQFFAAPYWGQVSDRIGRKPVLLLSLACSAVSYIWLGLAGTLWMLFAARLLGGAGAGNIAAAQAYVTDVTSPENRAKGIGRIGAARGFGFIVGPAVGGLLAGAHPSAASLAWPAFAAAFMSALAFALAAALLKESRSARQRSAAGPGPGRFAMVREALGRPNLRHLIILFFFSTTAFAGMESVFALWVNSRFGWGPLHVGWVFFFIGLVAAAVQGGLIGRLTKRLGEAGLAMLGAALLMLGLIGLPFGFGLASIVIAMGFVAFGFSCLNPAVTSLVSREADSRQRGAILGVSRSGQSLARILGPLIAGAVYSAAGRNAPYYLGALIMAGVVAMTARIPREQNVPSASTGGAVPPARPPNSRGAEGHGSD